MDYDEINDSYQIVFVHVGYVPTSTQGTIMMKLPSHAKMRARGAPYFKLKNNPYGTSYFPRVYAAVSKSIAIVIKHAHQQHAFQ